MTTNVDVQDWPREVQAQLQFLTWLQDRFPNLYKDTIELTYKQAAKNDAMDGLGFTFPKIDWSKLTENLVKVGTAVYTIKAQKDIIDTNLDRVQQGLPPIDPGVLAPVIRTEIDIQPEIAESLKQTFTSGRNMALVVVAAALGAFLIFR